MSSAQTGGVTHAARIERAERLALQFPFASEFLDFYRYVAAYQKNLKEKIPPSSGIRDDHGFKAREPLDLAVLLPHYRGFLSVIERHAPEALAASAKLMASLGSDSWLASLDAYWQYAGKFDQQVGAFAQFLSRAFLQPYAEFCAAQITHPAVVGAPKVCPLCGSRPLLGVLRPEGDGGKRFLACCFCSEEWEFRRILCPTCGEEAENKLPVYVAEQMKHLRVEACESCKFYLLSVDLTKDGHAIPLVDDLAAIPLALWAHEQGYRRLQPNLLGT